VELLRLGSPDRIEQLAARAVEGSLPVRKLRDLVRKERDKTKGSRGRKPTPQALRALRSCVRDLRDESTGRLALRRDDIDRLSEAQLAEARSLVETLSKRVEELAKLLG
jgi:hypothetical protein